MKITEMWGFLLYRTIEMLARINSLKLLLCTLQDQQKMNLQDVAIN